MGDRSCLFCGFFRYGIVNRLFIYPSLASTKRFSWVSSTNYKFSLNVRLLFGFPSIEIKSGDR